MNRISSNYNSILGYKPHSKRGSSSSDKLIFTRRKIVWRSATKQSCQNNPGARSSISSQKLTKQECQPYMLCWRYVRKFMKQSFYCSKWSKLTNLCLNNLITVHDSEEIKDSDLRTDYSSETDDKSIIINFGKTIEKSSL